jgi:hypothetical protein
MTRTVSALLPLALVLASQYGCIYYENSGDQNYGDGNAEGNWWDDLDGGDDTALDGPGDVDDSDEGEQSGLIITPDHAAAGETLLITLSATIEFDFNAVLDVHFDGPVTIDDVTVRDGEILIVATVDANAAPGDVSVWVEGADGQAWECDTSLTIDLPPPSGDDSSCN